MEKKEVYAVLMQEELDAFEGVQQEILAVQKLQEGLVDRLSEVYANHHEIWKELRVKYNLPDKDLRLDHSTREITDKN